MNRPFQTARWAIRAASTYRGSDFLPTTHLTIGQPTKKANTTTPAILANVVPKS